MPIKGGLGIKCTREPLENGFFLTNRKRGNRIDQSSKVGQAIRRGKYRKNTMKTQTEQVIVRVYHIYTSIRLYR